MKQAIVHVALVVRDYDEAIRFFTQKLDFTLVEDTYQPTQDKRWVLVAPPGSDSPKLLLARATRPNKNAQSAIKPAAECSSSSAPTISGATTIEW